MKVGKVSTCDFIFDESMFIGTTDEEPKLSSVSRIQFLVNKVGNNITLLDKSMNGTYVNGVKVGKDKEHRLKHGDIIAILHSEYDAFLFISEARMKQMYPQSLVDKYIVGRVLGEGASAVVKEAFLRSNHERVALKIIKKERWPSRYSKPEEFSREVDIASHLDHPCVIKMLDVFDENEMFVIAMEVAPGGELFDQVVKEAEERTLTEATAKRRFFQISHAIAYLHKKHVCHRDLKLENILMMDNSPSSLLKITDFGLSKYYDSIDVLETFVGTPVYMAPEVISLSGGQMDAHSYTEKSDCWSLGVVLYILLSGTQPFKNSHETIGLRNIIMSGKYVPMTGAIWAEVTDDAKDLVSKLLVVDPTDRLSAEEIFKHEWLQMDKAIIKEMQQAMGLDESESVSRQRIQGKIGKEGNTKRKRYDTESDLQWARMGKKRFVAFVHMCCDKMKKVNWGNEK